MKKNIVIITLLTACLVSFTYAYIQQTEGKRQEWIGRRNEQHLQQQLLQCQVEVKKVMDLSLKSVQRSEEAHKEAQGKVKK